MSLICKDVETLQCNNCFIKSNDLWGCGNCYEFYKSNICKIHPRSWEKRIVYYCSKLAICIAL